MSKGTQQKRQSKVNSKKAPRKSEQKELSIPLSDKIQIVTAFIALLSFFGVLLTLNEMRKDRDAAYKPAVLMNATDFQII